MKKLIFVLAGMSIAGVAQGALLQCTPVNVNTITADVTTNPTNVNCGAIDAGAGNIITSLAIRALGSFNDAHENSLHQLQFDFTHSLAPAHSIMTGAGDFTGDAFPSTGSSALVGTQTFAASVVSVVTSNLNSYATPANASVSVWLSYETAPVQTGIPEPSTMALLGSALVGLGLISRRKK